MEKHGIIRCLTGAALSAAEKITDWDDIQEIRLRVNRPMAATVKGKNFYITENGQLTYNSKTAVTVTEQDVRRTFEAVCQYSVHSFQREIAQGFITIKGGHRVGFCGTPVLRDSAVENIKNINSMNFRIAREIIGCADKLFNECFSDGLCSLLLAGAPSSGKTTLLRDLARLLGERCRAALIDERGELAASCNGVPQNDVGVNTDVFDGYGKAAGISAAVRVMSPQVIICDEMGSAEDFEAVHSAAYSGVCTVASIHAADMNDLKRRGVDLSCFDRTAFLSGIGNISSIVKRGGANA